LPDLNQTGAELWKLPLSQLQQLLSHRQLSPTELVTHYLDRVERLEPSIRAFVYLDRDDILSSAKDLERRYHGFAELPPLYGIPVPIKDLIAVKGVPFTRGSKLFQNHIAEEDAPVVTRLRNAGAIIFGKTQTSEFGWKAATANRLFPETRNPWSLDHSAGGSSGGSAAAVAAGLCPVAIGTDAAGSIRIPAAFCGIYGMKPSMGRVPVFPPAPVGPLTQIGPFTRKVRDAATILEILTGPDERDIYSLPLQSTETHGSLEKLRIGWWPTLGFMPIDPEILRISEQAVQRFEDVGCELVGLDIQVDDPRWVAAMYYQSGIAMAATKFDHWRDLLDPDLVPVVDRALQHSAIDFAKAQFARGMFTAALARVMEKVDLLITPATPVAAFKVGNNGPEHIADEPVDPFEWLGLTAAFNLTGYPAASIPCGQTTLGLPVGLQIVGPRFADALVLSVSQTFEHLAPVEASWPAIV